ncbi:hypothetical protein JOC77_000252 [Peribacillus deserti]|uniref:MarR family transcriptional regulator n=1 Tax=Peribacillus deserti TaxID=673318 RepID=A0ABS2QCJ2_9BACI|nr:hypothetical protein [Peribacillus deserti]
MLPLLENQISKTFIKLLSYIITTAEREKRE